ncbi:hypothetical protein [Micromonospora sp. C95]|uniref:hypothetical protein n=1 Tax=Micromonospora sp. C95 TaxID=2824882 RepID=UPI001B37A066|nr:hypothetical protein [Micromonospora sp. C95]MBQ1024537.1 hypothetical protein [Micromonospora sp. C95]
MRGTSASIQPDITVLHALPKTDEEDRYDTLAKAVSGDRLRADEPFPIDFDPADLLP